MVSGACRSSQRESAYYLHGHSVLLELLDYITALISPDRVTDNWREMAFDPARNPSDHRAF